MGDLLTLPHGHRRHCAGKKQPELLICFVIASFKRERSHRMLRPCAFSTLRHCDGRICPSTSHFPSAPGNCPLCSVQKRFSG